jgi:hypothetical protein
MPDNPPRTNLDKKFVDKLGLYAMDDLYTMSYYELHVPNIQ